jgi:hypothetical protein
MRRGPAALLEPAPEMPGIPLPVAHASRKTVACLALCRVSNGVARSVQPDWQLLTNSPRPPFYAVLVCALDRASSGRSLGETHFPL